MKDNGKRINTGLRLLPATIETLDFHADRLGVTRAATVEALVSQFAHRLKPAALPPDHRGTRGKGRRK